MLKQLLSGKFCLAVIFAVFGVPLLAAQLTPDQQAAKERGIALYNQYKDGEPDLRIAAAAGDREAQYYLAEDLRHTARFMTAEAYKWYVAAAEQGDYYAMFRLGVQKGDLCSVMGNCPEGAKSPGDWMKQLWATAKPLAEQGDGEAMMILYNATGDLEWLEKSAAAGYARGQWFLAAMYEEGKGFFLLPWKRNERVEELFKEAATGGYPPAIIRYVGFLYRKGDLVGAREWTERVAKTGLVDGVANFGAYLAHEPDKFNYPLDRVKGYSLISLLLDLSGGGNMIVYAENKLANISVKVTPKEIEEAKELAKNWKSTHPPLSFFPDKLGF